MRATSPERVPEELIETLVDESLQAPARIWKDTLLGLIDTDPARSWTESPH